MSRQETIKAASKREQKKARFHPAEREQARDGVVKTYGTVQEAYAGERFRVELENGVTITATLSGRIRRNHIRVMPGDRVEIELSPYDLTHGRISYRK